MKPLYFLVLCVVGCALLPIKETSAPRVKRMKTVDSLLARTNEIRAEYGAPPLVLSDSLNQLAKEYAEILTADCKPENQVHSLRQGVSENLYWRKIYTTPMDAIECWYREKEYYTPGEKVTIKKSHLNGHYTAMVSRRSKQVGFGWLMCEDGAIVVVAYYYPVGNILNEEP